MILIAIIVVVILGAYLMISNSNRGDIINSEKDIIISANLGSFQYVSFKEFSREEGGKYYKAYYDGGSNWGRGAYF